VLRSGGTVSKNKTQTVYVSTLVKKVIIKFLLFNDLPVYVVMMTYCSAQTVMRP